MECPKCKLSWDVLCEQTACIELFGECISCMRYKITEHEIDEIRCKVQEYEKANNE